MKNKLSFLIAPFLLLGLWITISTFELIDPFFLPGPFSVFLQLFELLISGEIFVDILSTLKKVTLAFSIAIAIGTPTGLILGMKEKIYRKAESVIDFMRSTPPTALFPLFLLIFGITDKSKIAVAAFASILIIIFNSAYGVIHAKKIRILAAQVMGATKFQIFKWIIFYESLPQIFIGLRNAVSISLIVIIVTEMFIGSTNGLGRLIINLQTTYDIKGMYAVIILTGIIGYSLNAIFLTIEKRILHWTGQ